MNDVKKFVLMNGNKLTNKNINLNNYKKILSKINYMQSTFFKNERTNCLEMLKEDLPKTPVYGNIRAFKPNLDLILSNYFWKNAKKNLIEFYITDIAVIKEFIDEVVLENIHDKLELIEYSKIKKNIIKNIDKIDKKILFTLNNTMNIIKYDVSEQIINRNTILPILNATSILLEQLDYKKKKFSKQTVFLNQENVNKLYRNELFLEDCLNILEENEGKLAKEYRKKFENIKQVRDLIVHFNAFKFNSNCIEEYLLNNFFIDEDNLYLVVTEFMAQEIKVLVCKYSLKEITTEIKKIWEMYFNNILI